MNIISIIESEAESEVEESSSESENEDNVNSPSSSSSQEDQEEEEIDWAETEYADMQEDKQTKKGKKRQIEKEKKVKQVIPSKAKKAKVLAKKNETPPLITPIPPTGAPKKLVKRKIEFESSDEYDFDLSHDNESVNKRRIKIGNLTVESGMGVGTDPVNKTEFKFPACTITRTAKSGKKWSLAFPMGQVKKLQEATAIILDANPSYN